MTIRTALAQGSELLGREGIPEPRLTAEVLLSHAVHRDRIVNQYPLLLGALVVVRRLIGRQIGPHLQAAYGDVARALFSKMPEAQALNGGLQAGDDARNNSWICTGCSGLASE